MTSHTKKKEWYKIKSCIKQWHHQQACMMWNAIYESDNKKSEIFEWSQR